jgi:hypothetical protein
MVELEQEDGSAASSSSPPVQRASICGGWLEQEDGWRPPHRLRQCRGPQAWICDEEGVGGRCHGSARLAALAATEGGDALARGRATREGGGGRRTCSRRRSRRVEGGRRCSRWRRAGRVEEA